jgi:anti-anti-sigma factor
MEEETRALLDLVGDSTFRSIIVDFGQTDYFGSMAVGLLTRLRLWAESHNACIVFCSLSAHEEIILQVTGVTRICPVFPSRKAAFNALTA